MSVSLYYNATRPTPLTTSEAAAVKQIAAAHEAAVPCPDEECLYLYDDPEPGEILTGSTKVPFEPAHVMPMLAHVLGSVTELRRALPDAEWRVAIDEVELPWDEKEGYALPGYAEEFFEATGATG